MRNSFCIYISTRIIVLQIYFVDYLRIFALNSHWYLFEDHSYTTWRGLATVWISLSGTFIWNFIDLFIMLVSSALAAQFNVLNRALRAIRGKVRFVDVLSLGIDQTYSSMGLSFLLIN